MHFRVITWRALLACALAAALQLNASVIVQLKVVEGEGTVYRTGGRATRGLTVLVTDEAGKPVPGASVSFRLPDSGPSGVFTTGLRTEVVTTDVNGRASVWGMQWNKTAGPFEIRITAIKDQARAGIVSTQYLNDTAAVGAAQAGADGTFKASHSGKTKWILIAAGVGAGAAAAMFLARSHTSPAAVTSTPATTIGGPTIIVGHP
jgi:hypothetical protein